jgi:hypothetical protein
MVGRVDRGFRSSMPAIADRLWPTVGNECWCNSYAPDKKDLTEMSECDHTCSGDDKDKCGGANRMSVWSFFRKDDIESFAPGGAFTPVYTYSIPERTMGYNVDGQMVPTVYPGYTVEVVASAQAAQTTVPGETKSDLYTSSSVPSASSSVPSETASATAAATQSLT